MQTNLKIKNLVFVGFFNLSNFDKYFFIKNKIVEENEILPNSKFDLIGGIQLITNRFDVLILPNQLIISSKIFNQDKEVINVISSLIIQAGNVQNITAFGMNFHWFMEDNTDSLPKLTRELFYNDNIKLFSSFFNDTDSVFGIYASRNFDDARLKLDVKPGRMQDVLQNNPSSEIITFAFNFHFDIKNKNDNTEVLNFLKDYDLYQKESERIISIYR